MSAPSIFGPYLIYRRLAVGGMAEIFLAKLANGDGRWIALKVMLPHNAGNAEHESMFSDEARLLLSIHHPNIVSAFDFVRVDDRIAVALEFVPGNDLSIVMRRMRESQTEVPIALALEIAMAVAAGLHHAHTLIAEDGEPLYLVHRDVSPENILLGVDGSIKVADFGVAKARGMHQVETKTGIIKGKLRYMAPEYATGNMQDVRSDIFSLALCLFELLTGTPAYDDSTLGPELVESIKYARIPTLRSLRPECPPLLERLMLKSLAVSPMDRFTTAESMRRALEKVLSQIAPSPVTLSEFMIGLNLSPVLPTDEMPGSTPDSPMAELEPTGQMNAAKSFPPLQTAKPELVSLTDYRQIIDRAAAGETRTAAVIGHQHPSRTSNLVELQVEFESIDDETDGDGRDEGSATKPTAAIALFEDESDEPLPQKPSVPCEFAPTSESAALGSTDAFAVLPPTLLLEVLATTPDDMRPPNPTVAVPVIGHTPNIASSGLQPFMAPQLQPSQNFSAPPSSGPKMAAKSESDDFVRPPPPKYSAVFVKLAAFGIIVIVAMFLFFWVTF